MAQADSSALRAQSATKNDSTKKITRTVFAGIVSAGLVGTFALPAYAAPSPTADVQYAAQTAQTLKTVEVQNADFDVTSLAVGENTELLQAEEAAEEAQLAREREEQERLEAQQQAQSEQQESAAAPAPAASPAVPAGASASSLTAAALAQVGVYQDCTDLVQNSLAAIGKDVRRDQGGYDRGPGLGDWTQFGTVLPGGANIQPGDIIIWSDGPHVAIALGDGMAVHGGYGPGGMGTQVDSIGSAFAKTVGWIVRPH